MKKFLLFFFISFFPFYFLLGQNPLLKQWDYRFGGDKTDFFTCFQQTADKGYVLGGTSFSGMNGNKSQGNWDLSLATSDYWILKIDSMGQIQWDKTFGGTSSDRLQSICKSSDGGYILGGYSASGISGDKTQPNILQYDFWIVKLDSFGSKQWDRTLGGNGTDYLYCIQQTMDRGYILGGISNSGVGADKSHSNNGFLDYWIIKVDSIGIKQWDANFGGPNYNQFRSLQQTTDFGYILGGYSNSGIGGNKSQATVGINDYWIVKIDSLGNLLWEKDFGGIDNDYLSTVQQTSDNGYILAGYSESGNNGDKTQVGWGNYDFWILKIDSLGIKQWDRDFGGNGIDECYQIDITKDQGYLISGDSYSPISGDKSENNLGLEQAWIVKTDSLGVKMWDKTVLTLGHDEASLSIESNERNYVVANYTNSGIGGEKSQLNWDLTNATFDFWIIKFSDTTQIALIAANVSSSDTTFCDKQFIDFYDQSTNNPTSWQWLFPGGNPVSSTQQNPTGIYYNSYGSFDVTLIACNAAGCDTLYLPNFINELSNPPVPTINWIADTLFCSPAYSYQWYDASGIISGANGQYYVYPQPGNYYVVVTDSNGCASSSFVIYTGIDEALGDLSGISIIPNPSDGNFVLNGVPNKSTIEIYEMTGRVIYSGKISSSPEHLQIKATDGIYFFEIFSGNKFTRKKFVLKN
jgi:PKD repeat protein